jgi:hypothetical protein
MLDALPRTALFGLVTFSDRIGLWDVKGAGVLLISAHFGGSGG